MRGIEKNYFKQPEKKEPYQTSPFDQVDLETAENISGPKTMNEGKDSSQERFLAYLTKEGAVIPGNPLVVDVKKLKELLNSKESQKARYITFEKF